MVLLLVDSQKVRFVSSSFVRIAAIADLHVHVDDSLFHLQTALEGIEDAADVLLVPGDLTEMGLVTEMAPLAALLHSVRIPKLVVLGNHDRRSMRRTALKRILKDADTVVLDGSSSIIQLSEQRRIGIAGTTGTGGGFKLGQEEFGYGPRFTNAVQLKSRRESARLRRTLHALVNEQPDVLVVMSHFAPTTTTLGDEPPLKYWMLGNALLGRTIDEFKPNLVVHGHSHLGNEIGVTAGGTPVRNVALPVTGGISIFDLNESGVIRTTRTITVDSPVHTGADS